MTQHTLSGEDVPTSPALSPSMPQEMWWMVAQELSDELDFSSLFALACTNRGMSSVALPLLYSIHDSSPASNAHIVNIETTVCLWRAIILASLGEALFPYHQWIKTIRLGNLGSLLEDNMTIRRNHNNPPLHDQFFAAPLQDLAVRDGDGRLEVDAVVTKVADLIINRMKSAADKQGREVGLLSLEGPPRQRLQDVGGPPEEPILTRWVTTGGLTRLKSIRLDDGAVLNSDLATAIRENCPAFNTMACYMCRGPDVDATLAGFFNNLAPNTLESFAISSSNDIGKESFKALSGHAKSLKFLWLQSMTPEAVGSLNHLSQCLEIEHFTLEATREARNLQWDESVYSEVVQWLQRCDNLFTLDFQKVPGGTKILGEALESSKIRLRTLNVKSDDISPELYQSLGSQTDLVQLSVRIVDEDILEAGEGRRDQLVDSIRQCQELRELETNELLSIDQFTQITAALPMLREIDLNGDLIDDTFLAPLLKLPQLKAFTVFGPSNFTFDGILDFLEALDSDPAGEHAGFQIYIGDQIWDSKFSQFEEDYLVEEMLLRFEGRIDITYRADPDELHESDFSD